VPAPFLCFADFEFTCGGGINRWRAEMLSVGLVICDTEFNVVQRFYSTVKPAKQPKMTALCRELTHLTQEEINLSPDSDAVLSQVEQLLAQYPTDGMYVWGNYDQIGLSSDARMHKKCKLPYQHILKAAGLVVDIQRDLTAKMGLTDAVNISELSTAFGFVPENGTFHNAMNDAEGLFVSYKAVYTTDIKQNDAFQTLCAERNAKREAARKAATAKRDALALSVSLSEEGRTYYEGLMQQENIKDADHFLRLRYIAVKAIRKYPNDSAFLITEVNGRVRAYREFAFPMQMRSPKRKYYCFTAETLDRAVIAMIHGEPSIAASRTTTKQEPICKP